MLKDLCVCAALAFDPASLPPLDPIDAKTDIKAYMQPGVPSELQREALRRAWSADPAIRDFKDFTENDWDFTVAGSMPGFGELEPDLDGRMLADAVGKRTDWLVATRPSPADRASLLTRMYRAVFLQFPAFK